MEDKLLLTTKECVDYIGIGETTLRNSTYFYRNKTILYKIRT